jgi:hypothetical protein
VAAAKLADRMARLRLPELADLCSARHWHRRDDAPQIIGDPAFRRSTSSITLCGCGSISVKRTLPPTLPRGWAGMPTAITDIRVRTIADIALSAAAAGGTLPAPPV